jgi:amino acid transporter
MAEETKNPSRNVPNAMTGSMILVRQADDNVGFLLTPQTYLLAYIVRNSLGARASS